MRTVQLLLLLLLSYIIWKNERVNEQTLKEIMLIYYAWLELVRKETFGVCTDINWLQTSNLNDTWLYNALALSKLYRLLFYFLVNT